MAQAKLNWANSWLAKEAQCFIAGKWQSAQGSHRFTVKNPANNEEIASYTCAGEKDINAAVDAATKCFTEKSWRNMGMRERARIMRQIGEITRDHFEELATLEALANGKTFAEAYNDDMPDCGDIFDYYAGWIDKHYGESVPVESGFLNYTLNEPLGVVAQIVPWNFPLLMALWKVAPALATGNSVVIKPSEYTPFSLVRWFEVVHEKLDLPAGLLNLVVGDGQSGNLLTAHNGVHKVAFTGSTDVGKKIVANSAASNLKTVSLELGGKSPVLFFEDTPDLEEAIDRSFAVMFSHKGEKCSEPTRFYFHKSIYSEALERIKAKADAIRCGEAFSDGVDQGPQCYEGHFNKVMGFIDSAKEEGLKLVAGGQRDVSGENEKGFFVRPTVYADVPVTSRISREEIFGPILAVNSFESESEAVSMANHSNYGLAAGLYTSDVSRAHRLASELEAGMVFINRYGCYDFSSPFGGYKQSGWGKEMAIHSLASYTKTKSVWLKV